MLDLKNDSNFKNSKTIIKNYCTNFLSNFKKLRKLLKVSQQEIADNLEVDQKTYSNYENMKTEIPYTLFLQLYFIYRTFKEEAYFLNYLTVNGYKVEKVADSLVVYGCVGKELILLGEF